MSFPVTDAPDKLCNEHVTIIAFTASWCKSCVNIKDQLADFLKSAPGHAHFYWLDVQEVSHQELFKQFDIGGFPTILFYNPRTKQWKQFEGRVPGRDENLSSNLIKCADAPGFCPSSDWARSASLPVVPHNQVMTNTQTEPQQAKDNASSLKLQLCSELPTLLAFTGVGWCPHCVEEQPALNAIKDASYRNGSKFHVQQFDLVPDDKDMEQRKIVAKFGLQQTPEERLRSQLMIDAFSIHSFPTFLVYEPTTHIFVPVESLVNLQNAMSDKNSLDMLKMVPKSQQWTKIKDNGAFIQHIECTTLEPEKPKERQWWESANEQETKVDNDANVKNKPGSTWQESVDTSLAKAKDMAQEKWETGKGMLEDKLEQGTRAVEDKLKGATPSFSMQGATHSMHPQSQCGNRVYQEEEDYASPSAIRHGPGRARHQPTRQALHEIFCDTCPTIIAFTGMNWCAPCKVLHEDLSQLQVTQGCEQRYHLKQIDIDSDFDPETHSAKLCLAFGIDEWPTFILFNPHAFRFSKYKGPRRTGRDLVHAAQLAMSSSSSSSSPRGSNLLQAWEPPSRNLEIQLLPSPLRSRNYNNHNNNDNNDTEQVFIPTRAPSSQMNSRIGRQQQQPSGVLKMRAQNPTVLYFALSEDTFPHESEQQKGDDGQQKVDELHYCDAEKHSEIFKMFGMDQFPTVLIYCPKMNVFFKYTGTKTDTATIKKVYDEANEHCSGYGRNNNMQQWDTHPRVEINY